METFHNIAAIAVLANILVALYALTESDWELFLISVGVMFITVPAAAFSIPGNDKPQRYGGGLPF